MNKLINLTGQEFGSWTVIDRAENDQFGHIYWNCICKCGIKKIRGSNDLRRKRSTGCIECRNKKQSNHLINDLTGNKYGKLTVLSYYDTVKNKSRWMCLCLCSDTSFKIVVGYNLISNKTLSCGCLRKEQMSKRMKEYHAMRRLSA